MLPRTQKRIWIELFLGRHRNQRVCPGQDQGEVGCDFSQSFNKEFPLIEGISLDLAKSLVQQGSKSLCEVLRFDLVH
jgi:hypothetical protein